MNAFRRFYRNTAGVLNASLLLCRSSKTFISLSINLNVYADVFNSQPGLLSTAAWRRTGIHVCRTLKTPLSVNSYEDILFQYLSLLLVLFAFSV